MSATMQPMTLAQMFLNRLRTAGNAEALRYKKNGRWISINWPQYGERVQRLASVLAPKLRPQEIVCILSENCPKWHITDQALLSLGCVSAPIYPTNPQKEIAYVLNDCQARWLFVSNAQQLDKIRKLKETGEVPHLEQIVIFEETSHAEPWILTLKELLAQPRQENFNWEERVLAVKPDDLATLVYTSGTTGEPKGVMLTHHNLVCNVLEGNKLVEEFGLPRDQRLMLSFLPLSHIFERTCGYYLALYAGFTVAFAENITKLVDNMGEVKPTLLVSVPRIYEKLYARTMEQAQGFVKKRIVRWSLSVGQDCFIQQTKGRNVSLLMRAQHMLAEKIFFSKIKNRLGGRLLYTISGGAPLGREIADFLNAIGLNVIEGYGLSETSPVIAANRPDSKKSGTVGHVWANWEIKFLPEPGRERDGELLVRGPSLMRGYYNKPEATAEAIDAEGWLHTGDIGYLDRDGFLHITDRKKELIKTAGGKYVAPAPIENELKQHPLIEQVVIIGDRRKYCVAFIVPNFDILEATLGHALEREPRVLNEDPQVRSLFQSAIDTVNVSLGSWEQIKRFWLLTVEFSQEGGELTPSLKLKRRVIDEKYRMQIDAMYSPSSSPN